MVISGTSKPCFPPLPIDLSPPLLRQPAKLLQPFVHGVVHFPPPNVRRVTSVHQLLVHVIVAVVVSIAKPWFPT